MGAALVTRVIAWVESNLTPVGSSILVVEAIIGGAIPEKSEFTESGLVVSELVDYVGVRNQF